MAFGELMLIRLATGQPIYVRDLVVGTTVLCEDGAVSRVAKLESDDYHRDGLFADGVSRFHPVRGPHGNWVHAGFLEEDEKQARGQVMYEVWLDAHHTLVSAVTGRTYLTLGHGIQKDAVATHRPMKKK